MNKQLKEQLDWYISQPASYRRLWWPWAAEQPNYRALHDAARRIEKDADVLLMMSVVDERVRAGKPTLRNMK